MSVCGSSEVPAETHGREHKVNKLQLKKEDSDHVLFLLLFSVPLLLPFPLFTSYFQLLILYCVSIEAIIKSPEYILSLHSDPEFKYYN